MNAPKLTQLAFEESDFDAAQAIARRLGFTQTAYTTSSALWGLFCLPDRPTQKRGCVIKTRELGLLFVQDVEDLLMTRDPEACGPRRTLRCDMIEGCEVQITHVDNKGYLYCAHHGAQRKTGGIPTRKLRPIEIRRLESGQTIRY